MSMVPSVIRGACIAVPVVPILFSIALASVPGVPAVKQTTTLVIRGATMFDSIKGVMLADRTIVARNGRIVAVAAPGTKIEGLGGARVIDARGKYVIPGLIDAHAHVVHHSCSTHVTGDELLPLFLAAGVTTLRDAGDPIFGERMVQHYADTHPDLCPSIFMCSMLIDGDPPFHPEVAERVITDPKEVPAVIDDLVAWGITTIKMYVNIKEDVFRKVIEEGHKRGLVVTAHLGTVPAQTAVAAGLDCFEHIWGVSYYAFDAESSKTRNIDNPVCDELIRSMVDHNVRIAPTLVEFEALYLRDQPRTQNNSALKYMPARALKFWKAKAGDTSPLPERLAEVAMYKKLVGKLYRAGVTILAGTDTYEPFVVPGDSLHRELELLVESGMPPSAALQAATINTADILHQKKELGSIEAGKRADLVVLDADPLADIKNVRHVNCVVHKGLVAYPDIVRKSVPRN